MKVFNTYVFILIIFLILCNCEQRELKTLSTKRGGDITADLLFQTEILDETNVTASFAEAVFDSVSVPIEVKSVYFNDEFLLKYEDKYVLLNTYLDIKFEFGELYEWKAYGGKYFDSLYVDLKAPSNAPKLIYPQIRQIDISKNLLIKWAKPDKFYDNRLLVVISGKEFESFGYYFKDRSGSAEISKEILKRIEGDIVELSLGRFNTKSFITQTFSEYSQARVGIVMTYTMEIIDSSN